MISGRHTATCFGSVTFSGTLLVASKGVVSLASINVRTEGGQN